MISGISRILITLAVASLISGLGLAQEYDDQDFPIESEESASVQLLPVPLPVVIHEADENLVHRQLVDSEAIERAELDLVAQQGMDYATRQMANYSVAQTILILVGTVALIWTLIESRRAAKTAQQIFTLEQTPFCTLELTGASTSNYDEMPHFCEIKNMGRGAGIVTLLYRKWSFVVPDSPAKDIDPENVEIQDERYERLNELNLPIGGDSTSAPFASFVDQIGVPTDKSKWLYFQGFIEFESLDGKIRRRTGFCYVFVPRLNKRGFHVAMTDKPEKHWYHDKLPTREA